MAKQTVTHVTCPECDCIEVARDLQRGEAVCSSCGLVLQERIFERGPEWRAYTPDERASRSRVGIPATYSRYDKGLSTTMRVERDAFGRPLSPRVRRQMWRLRRWQIRSRIRGSGYRNLMQAMSELQRLSEKLHIPSSVQEMAAVIYRKALIADLIRGRSIATLVAGSLYAACRYSKIPRTLKEIADASRRSQKEIARAYRLTLRTLKRTMPIHDPLNYVTKIAEKAEVSSAVEGLAIKILRDAKSKHATIGKDPSGVAAAALYLASQLKEEKKSQKDIAKAAEVTEVTIRNRKRDLTNTLNLNFN